VRSTLRQKERSPFPSSASISVHLRFKSAIALTSKRDLALSPSASINVYLRFKSAIALTSKRAIDLSPIRVHQRASAVQKCDRCVKKSDRPFPHPRPSAWICGSKVRSPGASKRAIDLSPIRVHPRVSAVQKCALPRHKYSTIPTISSDV